VLGDGESIRDVGKQHMNRVGMSRGAEAGSSPGRKPGVGGGAARVSPEGAIRVSRATQVPPLRGSGSPYIVSNPGLTAGATYFRPSGPGGGIFR
jgi:hypothetical protein